MPFQGNGARFFVDLGKRTDYPKALSGAEDALDTVVFDLDGTLIDSAPDIHAAANRMLADMGQPDLPLETIIGFIGNGVKVLVERCLAHLDLARSDADVAEALGDFMAYYNADLTTLTRPFPGAEDLLSDLGRRGIKMGVCTNKPEQPARLILSRMGLADHFAAVIGGDSLGQRKPEPAPLLATIAELGGAPERTLYVGDSETDYRTALNAGVPFAYFEGGYQRRPIEGFAPGFRVSALSEVGRLIG